MRNGNLTSVVKSRVRIKLTNLVKSAWKLHQQTLNIIRINTNKNV